MASQCRGWNFRSKAVLSAAEATAHNGVDANSLSPWLKTKGGGAVEKFNSKSILLLKHEPTDKADCSRAHRCYTEKAFRDKMTNQRLTGQLGWNTQCVRERDTALSTIHCISHQVQWWKHTSWCIKYLHTKTKVRINFPKHCPLPSSLRLWQVSICLLIHK